MTISEIITLVINNGPEIFSTWALIKASIDVIKIVEKNKIHQIVLVITNKGAKVKSYSNSASF
jgi:hypothetical protein